MNAPVCPKCSDDGPIELEDGSLQCVLCLTTWPADTPDDGAFEELMREADEEAS